MSASLVHLSRSRAVLAGALVLGIAAAVVQLGIRNSWTRVAIAPEAAAWQPLRPAPIKRFEAAVASIGDRVFVLGGFRNVQIQISPEVWSYDVRKDTWAQMKNMPAPATHANAVVVDGIVWMAGGFTGDSPGPATAVVWRYDPAHDSWSQGPSLPAPRGGGGLSLLDGKLHYIGGYGEDREQAFGDHWVLDLHGSDSTHWKPLAPLPLPRGHLGTYAVAGAIYAVGGAIGHDPYPRDVADVHRYDPVADRWTEAAPLPEARSHFEPSSFVWNGKIFIAGGRSRPTGHEALDDVTFYDPALDRWLAGPPLPEPRHSPIAALTPAGIIVGLGGRWGSDPDRATMWQFHFEPGSWYRTAPMPSALGEVAAAQIGNRVYVVGQDAPWTFAYDVRTGRWDDSTQHAVRPALGNHHAAEVWGGKLYLFGGVDRGQGTVQIYDPVLERWQLGPPMPFATGSCASAVIGNRIYLAGGIVGSRTTDRAVAFDPVTGAWTTLAPMPRGRNHAAAATDGRLLYVVGGRGAGSGDSNYLANGFDDVQIYDPATNRWIASGDPGGPPPLPRARGGMGKAVFVQGELWVIGGETLDGPGAVGRGVFDRVDIYDPRTNRWREGPPMGIPRHGIFPVLLPDRIFVPGGGIEHGVSSTNLAEYLLLPPATGR